MVGKRFLKAAARRIPDVLFLKIKYRIRTGKVLNLKNPVGFNEKLQWLKLFDRDSRYTMWADKYEAKHLAAKCIGEEHIIPNLGVWKCFDDIDFDSLPDQFVLKCTHDSGGLIICKEKSSFNREKAKRTIEKSLKTNYYWQSREWVYKDIAPRVLAEQYMVDDWAQKLYTHGANSDGLIDYKFYCFHGKPQFLYVGYADIVEGKKNDALTFLDFDWNITPFCRSDHKQISQIPPKPDNFIEMYEIAEKLSADIPFVRVDLYCIDGKIYFSEMTFCPGGGFGIFSPEEWEHKIGDWIHI